MGLVGAVLGVFWVRFKATPEGRRKIDHWKMNAPLIGKARKQVIPTIKVADVVSTDLLPGR